MEVEMRELKIIISILVIITISIVIGLNYKVKREKSMYIEQVIAIYQGENLDTTGQDVSNVSKELARYESALTNQQEYVNWQVFEGLVEKIEARKRKETSANNLDPLGTQKYRDSKLKDFTETEQKLLMHYVENSTKESTKGIVLKKGALRYKAGQGIKKGERVRYKNYETSVETHHVHISSEERKKEKVELHLLTDLTEDTLYLRGTLGDTLKVVFEEKKMLGIPYALEITITLLE